MVSQKLGRSKQLAENGTVVLYPIAQEKNKGTRNTNTYTYILRIEDRTNQNNNNNRPNITLKLKGKSKNMGNITSIKDCYPRNG